MHFVETVWKTPIKFVHFASVLCCAVLLGAWACSKQPKIGTVLSGPAALGLGQAIVALMERSAEDNLGEDASKKL